MSIPVDLDALRAQVSRFGPHALLVTTSPTGPPHVSSVVVGFDGDNLAMGAGRKTRANVAEHPEVALVWSNAADKDYCLIVDAVTESVVSETLVVRPTTAVLHRVASASADVPVCAPLDR